MAPYGKEYVKLNTSVYTAEDAARLCYDIDGILPEPKKIEENNFVGDMLEIIEWIYLGLNDKDHDGHWVTNTFGEQLTWTLWATGQPDVGRDQNCAVLRGQDKRWMTFVCQFPQGDINVEVVCEKRRKYTIYQGWGVRVAKRVKYILGVRLTRD